MRRPVSDDLYISWEDAVDKAFDRYQTVIDNYKSGKYPGHKRMTDEFFKMSGDLMDVIGEYRPQDIPDFR